jgi:hypothetical protein
MERGRRKMKRKDIVEALSGLRDELHARSVKSVSLFGSVARRASVRVTSRSLFIGPSCADCRNPSQSVTSPRSVRWVTRESYSAIPTGNRALDQRYSHAPEILTPVVNR